MNTAIKVEPQPSSELFNSCVTFPKRFASLRVAIVHYWFMGRTGGERVVEALADIFPQADLFTLVGETASNVGRLAPTKAYYFFSTKNTARPQVSSTYASPTASSSRTI